MGEVHHTTDRAAFEAEVGPPLLADPVRHNLPLSLLDRLARGNLDSARFWWVEADGPGGDSGRVDLAALQTDPERPLVIIAAGPPGRAPSPDEQEDLLALADAVHTTAPGATGANGEAATVSAFAAAWALTAGVPVAVELFQALYRLDPADLVDPPPVAGRLRLARDADMEALADWPAGFARDAFGRTDVDGDALAAELLVRVLADEVWLWDDGGPRSMCAVTRPVGGTSRIQQVYTPPEHRARGRAAACVAGAVRRVAATGVEHCVLYADLANPTSTGLYRRLGFRPVTQALNVGFGRPD